MRDSRSKVFSTEERSPKRLKPDQASSSPNTSLCGVPTTPIASPLRRLSARHSPLHRTNRAGRHTDCLPLSSLYHSECSYLSNHKHRNLIFEDSDSDTLIDPVAHETTRHSVFLEKVAKPFPPILSQISIFEIPEIVHRILTLVDCQFTKIPHEKTPVQRLQEEDKEKASTTDTRLGELHSCLLVNKLFNAISTEIIHSKVLFNNDARFRTAAAAATATTKQPSMVVLHRLFRSKQESLDAITLPMDFTKLHWLELYMCPKLAPTSTMFAHGTLRKLVITGLRVMDDPLLASIARQSPQLEWLDLRACELVLDAGIYQVSKFCRQLTTINFGRKAHGRMVTDASIVPLVSNNRHLKTVGLAGCKVSDRVLWALAGACGASLERLSLNNCPLISDLVLAQILQSRRNPLPRLCVLELRFNMQLEKMQPVIAFKRRQNCRGIAVLIEVCPPLAERMATQQREMDANISRQIFNDIQEWVNCPNSDTDYSFEHLLSSRLVLRD